MPIEHEPLEHEPLRDATKDLRPKWYRCPIDREDLRELMRPSDAQGWIQAGGHLAIFVGTGGLTYFFYSQALWLPMLLTLFAHGTAASFFKGIAAHELGHGTVFKTKVLNRFFLHVFSLFGWHNHHEYAVSHTYHHRYTLHSKGDREIVLPQYPNANPFYLVQLFTFNFTGGLMTAGIFPIIKGTLETAFGGHGTSVLSREWSQAIYTAHQDERRHAVRWARQILIFHGGVLVVTFASEIWILPFILSFQQFTANALKHFVGIPMHCGLRDNIPDFRKCVRTITLDPISEFLYWRMNWHLEHHMFAGVPCYNLKKLHKLVAHDMPTPRTLSGAWQEMRETWRRQQNEPGYQFDTPVPSAGRHTANAEDELASSIGDLAPDALAN